jgi:peptidoglycan hydrolase CwlO-like protein
MTSSMSVSPYSTKDNYLNVYADTNKADASQMEDSTIPYMADDEVINEDKSSSMAKMVGLTILGATLGASTVYFAKRGKISGLEKEITAAKAKVEEMTKEVTTAKDNLSSKAKDVTNLQNKVKTLENEITNLKNKRRPMPTTPEAKKPNVFQRIGIWFSNLFHKKA